MLERRRRFNGISALKIAAVVFAVIAEIFFYGCGYYVAYKIDDYDVFIDTYTKYSQTSEIGDFKTVKGFTPIIERYFLYGKEFSANTAFVKTEIGNALLTVTGDLISIDEDFTLINLIDGKYVFENGEKYGVKDVLNREIVPPLYERIRIIGNTVLAISEQSATIYCGGTVVGESDEVNEIELLDENYIYFNGYICNLDFTVCLAGGYTFYGIPVNNIVTVNLGNSVGYYDIENDRLIGARYYDAAPFSDGVAVAVNDKGESVVIDTVGNVLYTTADKILGDKSGNYMCYVTHNMYGVLDNDFNDITGALFGNVKYEKAAGDYLIVSVGTGESLYSLKELKYAETVYDSIEYCNGIYFCKSGESMFLLDSNSELIVECNDASFGNGILMVKYGEKYSYYKRAEL